MNLNTEVKKRTYKKLGFTSLETVEIVQPMNILLANYHIHYQKMRNFHWNVTGKDFFELHEKFEEMYNEAKQNIDLIAERIRVFGQTPVSTLYEYLEMSELKEVGTEIRSDQMVEETMRDLQTLLSLMVDVTDSAINMGDVGTEHMMNAMIFKTEKTHWMLTSWSGIDKPVFS
jgi:starvation-inducible DNA-binding protein